MHHQPIMQSSLWRFRNKFPFPCYQTWKTAFQTQPANRNVFCNLLSHWYGILCVWGKHRAISRLKSFFKPTSSATSSGHRMSKYPLKTLHGEDSITFSFIISFFLDLFRHFFAGLILVFKTNLFKTCIIIQVVEDAGTDQLLNMLLL